jgi:hypothetical protein
MAKRIFLFIVVASFLSISVNAQKFIGGNFAFRNYHTKAELGSSVFEKTGNTDFNISPFAGWFLSDKFAAGVALDLRFSAWTTDNTSKTTGSSTGIGISPFIRYYALKWNKFSLYGQCNLNVNLSSSRTEVDGNRTTGPKVTNLSLNLVPAISYDISDKLSLETAINFVNFGAGYIISKNGTATNTHYSVGFGAGLDHMVNIGSINIGAIYKF